MITLNFAETEPPTEKFDTVPPVIDIEYPCKSCGREAGPYGGHGRKPVFCADCKAKTARKSSGPRVSGKSAELAAQATQSLSAINGIIAMVIGAMGFTDTMKAVFEVNEDFEKTAYKALSTDPKMCAQILRVGEASARFGLGVAYLGMGMGIAPTLADEYKRKKAARLVGTDE
jgi:hypothetical protein